MEELIKEERTREFPKFNADIAYDIGKYITDYSFKENKEISVEIFAYGKIMYRFSSDLSTQNHDLWLLRKRNVVLFFNHSSKYIYNKINKDQSVLVSKYGLNYEKYAAVSGSFPIIIKDCGLVGAITVTGLTPDEDHQIVLEAIENNLKSSCNKQS